MENNTVENNKMNIENKNKTKEHKMFTSFQTSNIRIILFFCLLIISNGGCKSINLKGNNYLKPLDKVKSLHELKAYTGKKAVKQITGENRKKAYLLNYNQLKINYGENVEFQLRREQVILCPQTVDFLYSEFTPTLVKYKKGTRPELEKVVSNITVESDAELEKALAIMRFCRDLYKKKTDTVSSNYVYGGTEEELIEKPEELCETLSRLMVALCEVSGMPGRIVMHNIGGHICSEILIDGHWGYIDPRTGIYFLKKDCSIASVRDLCQDPSIINSQSNEVKNDVSDQWTWEYRAWKCQNMYFCPEEVNGFENYSLNDTKRYNYSQLTTNEVTDAGLFTINKQYVSVACDVFGLSKDWDKTNWGRRELKKIPIAYRNDGFSLYFRESLINRDFLEERYVNCFDNTNTKSIIWGLGPGSVFCYETKIGQIFGEGLTNPELDMLRPGDRWVNKNVMNLLQQGGPLKIAVERSHKIGLDIFARLEMNHEYGPASSDNWKWVALVGNFNKSHPEYRIGRSVMLDFKYKEVRDFKISILNEAAEIGVDGISMDFAVYPPFFENPDTTIMTQFIRDVRTMLNDVGARQNRYIKLMVRVPFVDYMEIGLDWKTWMKENLIDIIVPTHFRPSSHFDIRIEEFVDLARKTGVLVYPTLWQALGFVDTDPQPGDEKTGMRRYDKPKTPEIFFAQALLYHRAGADGLQLGFASNDEWLTKPWLNELAEPKKVEYADKQYMVDPIQLQRAFELTSDGTKYIGQRTVGLRIGDNIPEARKNGYDLTSALLVYMRGLYPGEKVEIFINGNGPVIISGDSDEEKERREMMDTYLKSPRNIFEENWWKRDMLKIYVDANWWRLKDNEIKIRYSKTSNKITNTFSIKWIDLLIDYQKKMGITHS